MGYIQSYKSNNYRKKNLQQLTEIFNKLRLNQPMTKKTFNKIFILQVSIKQFFNKTNCKWLLKNYPFPVNFVNILKSWLSNNIIFKTKFKTILTKLPQKSAIGISLTNFTLKGLYEIVLPKKKTNFDRIKFNYYTKKRFCF